MLGVLVMIVLQSGFVAHGVRPRIVLVDDHPIILEAATAALSGVFEVVAAVGSGAEAIAATARLEPDLALLDIAMPGLDGFQTASAIRARGSLPHLAFMSANLSDDDVLAGLACGGSAFVTKARMLRDLVPALEYARAGHVCVPSPRLLRQWRRPAGHRHDLQLYSTDAALIGGVVDFFGAGLAAGDAIVAIATPAHLDEIAARLRASGVDVAGFTESGRYTPLDVHAAIETVVRNGVADEALFVSTMDSMFERARRASGHSKHVSLFGEIAPQLYARHEDDAALAIERFAGAFAASRALSILCAYSMPTLTGAAGRADSTCAEHGAICLADAHD